MLPREFTGFSLNGYPEPVDLRGENSGRFAVLQELEKLREGCAAQVFVLG